MSITSELIIKLKGTIDIKREYSCNELEKIITDIYEHVYNNKKYKIKSKREPTNYNIFVKKHYSILHKMYPFLSRGLIMRQCGIMWRTAKENSIDPFEWDFYSI
tara:strand:- start:11929 stop:12240 length:312 start_codon:yes stop_codon:yes gene_type:complete